MADRTVYTIGHSDDSLEAFVGTLQAAGVRVLVDIRRLPGSRAHPHFNADALSTGLAAAGIEYRRLEALGGRRSSSKDVPSEVNGFWENRSFHNYADWALGDEFAAGLDELRSWAVDTPTAIMCAEAVWWRCHRRIVADHLLAGGDDVQHIVGPRVTPATMTPGAVVGDDGRVTYPAAD